MSSYGYTLSKMHRSYKLCGSTKFFYQFPTNVKHFNTSSSEKYDVVIVGGGIIGLATAREMIIRQPHLTYAVVEKENELSTHQTGHNSGVIHAGIYYTPGSLKAKLCVEGLKLTYKYCDTNKVPYKKCGKLIVATNPDEVTRLDNLYQRGLQNEVPGLRFVNKDEIKEIEPHCKGLKAIHSPETGIVDWGKVSRTYGTNFKESGGKIFTGLEVTDFKEGDNPEYPIDVHVKSSNVFLHHQVIHAKNVITCGGLYSDRLSAKSGCEERPKIVPFRGDYLLLKPHKSYLVNGNIYPVPDPNLPFLGVHFTPRMDGSIWLGPNAILAFKREGYKATNFNFKDFTEAMLFRGLWKLVANNLSYAATEIYRGVFMAEQVKQLQRFIPEMNVDDVIRGPSGVRAQALSEEGKLVDDFIFDSGVGALARKMLHVRNAPSPAATSSLAIAKVVADEAQKSFDI